MLSLPARRAFRVALVALALPLAASHLAAQNRRVDVKRFQWDPVVVHLAAEAQLGVEVYMSVHTNSWALTWIDPDSVAAWMPQLRALQTTRAASDSTSWLTARESGARMRIVKGAVQGHEAFAVQLHANPSATLMQAWLPAAYVADLSKALEKSVSAAREVARAPAIPNSETVYEEWDVDEPPAAAELEHLAISLPSYTLRGSAVVGFVVDSAGHPVPLTATVYECDDANVADRFERAIAAWHFVPGSRRGQHVATRVRLVFNFDTGGSFHVNSERIIPHRP
jgi:hypothetical protein